MRDNLSIEKNIDALIAFNSDMLIELKRDICQLEEDTVAGIKRFPKENADIIFAKEVRVYGAIYSLIKANYTKGCECESLEELYKEGMEIVPLISDKMGYIDFIQFFSLGVLLGIPKDDMQGLVNAIDKQEINDILLDYIVKSYGLKRLINSDKYDFGAPYNILTDVVSVSHYDKVKACSLLKEYIETKWLDGHAKFGWKTLHTKAGYVGLWSFEAGAVAKILGLDDSELKNSNHYPYDLVHYKDDCRFINVSTNNVGDNATEDVNIKGIPNCPTLEKIIPGRFHEGVDCIITDYKTLSDNEMWTKHNLSDIWFTADEYVEEKSSRELLGFIIVNYLVDEGYILQLDYKDNPNDYIADMESYWAEDVKVISFDLDNDQLYLAKVPCNVDLQNIYEVDAKDYMK